MSTIVYDDLEKFEAFLVGKGLESALDAHKSAGLPEEKIREIYFRFVKTLVAVGGSAGADRPVGMPWELVAIDNPYTSGGDVRVGLLKSGRVVAGAPIYVFRKAADGSVEKINLVTDDSGRVTVPGGPGEYMVNAVGISRPSEQLAERTEAHWQTVWASLTYEIAQ